MTDDTPLARAKRINTDDIDTADRKWSPTTGYCPLPRDHPRSWTPERQRLFIETLAETGSVSTAADTAGMSRTSAYRHRRRRDARAFAEAWDAALTAATQLLTEIAFERAIHGSIDRAYNADGELIGERHRTNDRLLMFLLRHHRRSLYGGLTDKDEFYAYQNDGESDRRFPAMLNALDRDAARTKGEDEPTGGGDENVRLDGLQRQLTDLRLTRRRRSRQVVLS
ncbi:MAG: hypothetical protein WA906_01045 [Pacificimonas sp.]